MNKLNKKELSAEEMCENFEKFIQRRKTLIMNEIKKRLVF